MPPALKNVKKNPKKNLDATGDRTHDITGSTQHNLTIKTDRRKQGGWSLVLWRPEVSVPTSSLSQDEKIVFLIWA